MADHLVETVAASELRAGDVVLWNDRESRAARVVRAEPTGLRGVRIDLAFAGESEYPLVRNLGTALDGTTSVIRRVGGEKQLTFPE